MTRIYLTQPEVEVAIDRLNAVASDDDGLVAPSDADDAIADLPTPAQQVVAADVNGGTRPSEAWLQPVHISDLVRALDAATAHGFELPTQPDPEPHFPRETE